MATKNRLRSLIIAAVALSRWPQPHPPWGSKVHVRVEDGAGTIAWSTVTPFTGTVQGHPLAQPTPLGALITATTDANVKLGLQWFDPYGFFINSIKGRAGTPTSGWAFKIGQKLATTGADGVTATAGAKYLFYYTKYDPITFATQPTLGISDDASDRQARRHHHRQGALVQRRRSRLAPERGPDLGRQGKVAVTGANGQARVKLTTKGRFQVRASFAGAIRSTRRRFRVT